MTRAQEKPRIGARVRALRNDAGLTQEQLAAEVDVAPETMSRIERGRLVPSTDLVTRIAAGLGVPAGALFDRSAAKPKTPTLRPVERRLLTYIRDLPDALVEDVIRGVRLLVEVGRQAPEAPRRHRR